MSVPTCGYRNNSAKHVGYQCYSLKTSCTLQKLICGLKWKGVFALLQYTHMCFYSLESSFVSTVVDGDANELK
jgi:hypothetical protein